MKIKIKIKRGYVNFGNKGFTLVEALLGLSAFCLIASLLPFIFQVLNNINHGNSRLHAMEWEVFSNQIKKEIRMSQRINPQVNKLFLTKDTDIILYEQFGTNLRRRVNLSGNEILLQNVKSVRFESIKNGVIVEVENSWKRKYSFTARVFIDIGN